MGIAIEDLFPGTGLFRVARDNEFYSRDNHDAPRGPLGAPKIEAYTVLRVEPTRRGSWRVECRHDADAQSETHFQLHRFGDLGLCLSEEEAWEVYRAKNERLRDAHFRAAAELVDA